MFKAKGKFLFSLIGADDTIGAGLVSKSPVQGLTGYKKAELEVYGIELEPISEGDTEKYLNGYTTSVSNYRIKGTMKIRPMFYPDSVESIDEFMTQRGGSLLDVFPKKYHWLEFDPAFKIVPISGFSAANTYLAITLLPFDGMEKKPGHKFLTLEFEYHKQNNDLT
jgi:hypothetical protein